jgi:transcriptional regulator with XRE-family HTH domain
LTKVKSDKPKRSKKITEDMTALQRSNAEADEMSGKIGQRIRMFRNMQGWTLADASNVTGIPTATLSRIENSKMSPTFGLLLKLMTGMNVGWLDLVGAANDADLEDQISFAYPGEAETFYLNGSSYVLPHLDTKLSETLHSVIFEVEAHSASSVGGLSAHHGIEMCYVLSGTLMLHIAGRRPQELPAGCTALFNSSLPHAYLAKPGGRARVLNVTVRDPLVSESAVAPFRSSATGDAGPEGKRRKLKKPSA